MANDTLSLTFGALADPTRRALLAQLRAGQSSVNDLAKPFNMTLPAISKHLKVLERAGLITRAKTAQWRLCTLNAKPMQEVAGYVMEYKEYWEASFDRLDAYLRELQDQPETE
ncbi:MAG TPA: metalloregulator ArsR/SmtB family transcription factor [Fimbriimonas sp.]|nr:metalloregulator ArsR/SmtB family transcription factor [Fimbriimonas sp.]